MIEITIPLENMEKITVKRLVALTNDCGKCIIFTQELQNHVAEALPDLQMEKITMEEVTLGFSELSKELIKTICNRFIAKIKPQMDKLFTKDWYQDKGEYTCAREALDNIQVDIQLPIDFMEWENVVLIVTTVFNQFVKMYIDAFMTRKFTLTKDEREIVKMEIAHTVEFLPPEEENGWVSTILKPLRIIEDVFETLDDEDLLQCISDASNTFPDLGEIVFENLIKKAGFSKENTELYLLTSSQFFKTKSGLNQKKDAGKKSLFGAYNIQEVKVEEKPSKTKKKKEKKKKSKEKEASEPTKQVLVAPETPSSSAKEPSTPKAQKKNTEVQEMSLLDFIGD